jgi:hypothetical protein
LHTFATPKDAKGPCKVSLMTPTSVSGFSSQRTIAGTQKKSYGMSGFSKANGGVSRNELNHKKSNTAQAAVFSKKLKNPI